MKKALIILSVVVATPVLLMAQGNIGLGLNIAVPTDEFREATDANAVGFNLNVHVPVVRDVPITMGFEFGYLLYGSHTQRETLEAQVTANGQVIDVIEIPLKVVTNNNLYHGHFSLRAQAPFGFIQPYVEALVGLRYYNTRTRVQDDTPDGRWSDGGEDNVIVQQEQLGDLVGSYGFGGGLHIRLSPNTLLDLRFDYLKGGRAKFYDADDTENWQVDFISGGDWDPDTASGEDLAISAEPREAFTNSYFITVGLAFPLTGAGANR